MTGMKKDPATIGGAAKFIALGVPLICSECETEATSRWTASKADPNKPVCMACYMRQVRRAFRSLASIVCILSALPCSSLTRPSYTFTARRHPRQLRRLRDRRCGRERHARVAVHGRRVAVQEVLAQRGSRRPRVRLVREGRGHCEVLAAVEAHRGCAVALHRVLLARGAHIPVLPTPLTRTRTRDVLRHGSFLGSPRAVLVSRSSQQTEILTDAGTTCGKCGSCKASRWYNSLDVPGGKICKKCWHEANSTIRKKKKQ